MRTTIISLLLLTTSLYAHSQIRVCGYYNGYWGEWEDGAIGGFLYGRPDETLPYLKVYGNNSGFCIYISDSHPSDYTFKFHANNFIFPDKKTRKEHLKRNEWYEYYGTVEYYIDNVLTTIKDILKRGSALGRIPVIPPTSPNARKRTVNATIKIAPYKDHPKVYNILFEGVGVGIDLGPFYFTE